MEHWDYGRCIMGVKIVKVTPALERMKKVFSHEKLKTLVVGFLNSEVAQIAIWNEYGTERIPPRPFMDITFNKYQNKWATQLEKLLVQNKFDLSKSLRLLGEIIRADIKITIETTDLYVPNAPSTQAKKGGVNSPLIDTGHMRDSIEYELR